MYISNRKTIPKNTAHATKLCSLLNKSVHAWHFEVLSGLLSPLTLEPLKTWIVISHAGLSMKLKFEKNLRRIGKLEVKHETFTKFS